MSIRMGDTVGFFTNSTPDIERSEQEKVEASALVKMINPDEPTQTLQEDLPHQDPHRRLVLLVQLEHRRRLKNSPLRFSKLSQAQLKYLEQIADADDGEVRGLVVDKAA